ncbi:MULTISPECIES: hypothetical protein [Pseudomonas]|uniref:Uncharacterized protein n=1 Tax=Pseudomonas putida TaxID=303 RepID=A0A1L7NPS7_PSEPU|nr:MULTISPECIES: hypothetical protein [Pseudomonas]MDH1403674.1 hypothetical protein [Pseudomonas sp. GD03730]BAW27443.1 Uncharacterized protein KF715C_pC100 [Pseudomonas putida]
MSVDAMAVLSRTFQNTNDLGRKVIQSDAQIVFDQFPDMPLLVKQFPWPVATPGDVIEYYGPNGQLMVQPKQVKTKQEGPVAFYETVLGQASEMLKAYIANGAYLDATVYEGRPDDYKRKEDLKNLVLVMDTPDRDWENDAQTLLFQGTLHFHWFANQ